MSKPPVSRDVSGQLIFLGTGTSHGVPVIGCNCPTCQSRDAKDRRTRCSVVLGLPDGNLLVDTPPDLRTQLLRERIGLVHAVLYTHEHADHLFGLDDLRIFAHYLDADVPLYCAAAVERRIRAAFDYAFDPETRAYPAGGIPRLTFRPVSGEPLELLGARATPIALRHGRGHVWGYRFGDVAYCTDTNEIPPASMALLEGLNVLILDGLRRRPHPTHFSLAEAVEIARRLAPKRTLFTHVCHDLPHEATNAALPRGMELAYDGLAIPLQS